MAILSRWDPFGEMQRLTDQVLRGWTGERNVHTFAPAVDIYEDQDAILVRAELPGVKHEDVHIDVENGVLTLSGERKLEREDKREGYHRIESVYGNFTRSFALPEAVDADNVEADMNEGVLTVRIPKKAEGAHKRIEVKTRGERKSIAQGKSAAPEEAKTSTPASAESTQAKSSAESTAAQPEPAPAQKT
jgi:HSP20 family protein